MMLIKTLLLISLLVGVALSCLSGLESPVTKSHHNNPYNRLFDDLFGDYNPQVIPLVRPPQDAADNSSALSLGLSLSVLNMDLDKDLGVMTVNGWLSAGWTDFRLSWDPVNYDGLNTIRVPASSVWIPDLSVYNSWNCDADQSKLDTVNYQVVISSSGYIIFVPALKMTVDCADGDTWTYTDSSNSCLIKIGTWTYDANNIALTTFPGKDQKMDLAYLSYNSPVIVKTQEEESIKTKRYDCCLEPYMEVAYRFTVEKAANAYEKKKVLKTYKN